MKGEVGGKAEADEGGVGSGTGRPDGMRFHLDLGHEWGLEHVRETLRQGKGREAWEPQRHPSPEQKHDVKLRGDSLTMEHRSGCQALGDGSRPSCP